MAMKMPLLLVQIDQNFLSLNLFENNTLTFSRFTAIDAADYDDPDDYVFEAVNENIFRMFQFQRAQNPNDPIQNVVFYGETTEYIRLTQELEKQDVLTSLLGIPSSVGGYENFDFQSYANAIGAMFKSNRDIERINLLEVDASQGKSSAGASFAVAWIGSALLSALLVGGVYVFFMIQIDQMNANIKDIDTWIQSEETQKKLVLVDEATSRSDKVTKYGDQILIASDNYITKPKLSWDVYQNIIDNEYGADTELDATITSLGYNSGFWTVTCSAEDSYGPSRFIANMYEQDIFREITYKGYSSSETAITGEDGEELGTESSYTFDVTFQMEPNLTPAEEAAAAEAAAAEAAENAENQNDEEVIA
jgi:type IV pilus assembly protein PilM